MSSEYIVDLTKLDGDGAFPCPKCGVLLNPDDESNSVYEIELCPDDQILLKCKRCGSRIKMFVGDGVDSCALERMQKDLGLKGIKMEKVTE